jgi:hypothetical protein
MKVANENSTSNDPMSINTNANEAETISETIGVPPLFTIDPF